MPPTTNSNDGISMSELSFINYDAYSDLDLGLDDSTQFLDLIQSNPDISHSKGTVLRSGDSSHISPAPSPTASDQDSASDFSATHRTDRSSLSAPAMNNGDVEMAGIWDHIDSNPKVEWDHDADFGAMDSMPSIFDNGTIDPAALAQSPFGDHIDFGDAQSAPRQGSSSLSDSSQSPEPANGSDESPPEDTENHNVFSFKGSPPDMQSPFSYRSKRHSVRITARAHSSMHLTSSADLLDSQVYKRYTRFWLQGSLTNITDDLQPRLLTLRDRQLLFGHERYARLQRRKHTRQLVRRQLLVTRPARANGLHRSSPKPR